MKFQPNVFDLSQITLWNDITVANAEGIPSLSVKNISNNLTDTDSKSFSDELNDFYLKNISDNLNELDSISNHFVISDLSPDLEQVTNFFDDNYNNRSVEVSPNLITTRKRMSNNELHSDIKKSKRSDNTSNDEASHQNAGYLNLLLSPSLPSSDISCLNDSLSDLQKKHIQKPAELIEVSVDDVIAIFDAESVENKSTIQEQVLSQNERWERNLNHLKQYIKDNGDALVPNPYPVKDKNGNMFDLGMWVKTQRRRFKNNELSEDRINILNGCEFIWNINQYNWYFNLESFKDYINTNGGDVLVPNEYQVKDKNGNRFNLGMWVNTQRKRYKNKELEEDRIDKLNKYKFIWDLNDYNWNSHLHEFKEYIRVQGHALVPSYHEIKYENGKKIKLGKWVANQRSEFNNGRLLKERMDILNKNKFIWDVRKYKSTRVQDSKIDTVNKNKVDYYDDKWEQNLKYLKMYIDDKGNALVPRCHITYDDNGNKIHLGDWVNHQRQRNKLNRERIAKLNAIGFIWSVVDYEWGLKLDCYKSHFKPYEKVPVKCFKSYRNEVFDIGCWALRQRKSYNSGKMKPNRIKLLKELGFVWNVKETSTGP